MTAFIDLYLPEELLGMPCHVQPRFSTQITVVKSGDEARNQNWLTPLRRVSLPEAVCNQSDLEAAMDHWLLVGGPANTFPFRDSFDFASVPLEEPNEEPVITRTDQDLGTADGFVSTFQLVKARTRGGLTYTEDINLPVVDSVLVGINGYTPAAVPGGLGGPYAATVQREGGLVTITPIPQAGLVITAGFFYDRNVRWEGDDSFQATVHSAETDGSGEIDLVEVRWC